MGVELILQGDKLTAKLSGDIDHHNGARLREQIDQKTSQTRPRELVLDFSDVTFMDSAGIGLILGRYRWMQDLGGTVRIVRISPQMEQLLTLSGIDKLVRVERPAAEPAGDVPKAGAGSAEPGQAGSREIFSDSSKEVNYHGK